MGNGISTIDYFIIVIYLVATTAFGTWFVKRSGDMKGFTLAGNLIPGWAIGLSLMATYLSSISFLANPGKSYASDWRPFVFSLTLPIAIWIAGKWFVPLYRNQVRTTAYEYLEQRFALWARLYMGAAYILLQIGRFAVVLYLMALALAALIDVDIRMLILGVGLLTVFYTIMGGFAAVIWTDVVQAVVLFLGGLLCLILLLVNMPGGWAHFTSVAAQQHKFALGPMDFNLAVEGFWVIFIFGIVENLKNFSVDQNYVQRFLSAPSEREAQKALWLGGMSYIPISALFFMIGTALFVYYLDAPAGTLPDRADQVFPYFIVHGLPAGIAGLVIAGVMAAGMSTLSSSLNSSATVYTVDFFKRYLNKDADDHTQLKMIRSATGVIGVIATLASLAMINARTVLDVWWQMSAIFGGGMLGLFLAAVLIPKLKSRQAMTATLAGLLFVAWASASKLWFEESGWSFGLHTMMIGVVGTLLIVVTAYLLQLVSRDK
ncbi:MAG: sodium:solute symporter [Gammaproteobacteria bacterium]|nr:sodium:solute symporter [Gammaproteobacteria bacterium]MBU1480178.1 sodium:solute symporter [Gammaproteobacteria bacterium]